MKIRAIIRKLMGIDLEAYIAALEKANRERQVSVEERLLLIANILDKVNMTLEQRHVNRKPPTPFMQDWEQVQAEELAYMMANKPKEEN